MEGQECGWSGGLRLGVKTASVRIEASFLVMGGSLEGWFWVFMKRVRRSGSSGRGGDDEIL